MTRRDCLQAALAGAGLLAAPVLAQPGGRVLRLVSDVLPPFVLEEGHPAGEGIDIDIARAALNLAGGYQLTVSRLPWRRALAELESGRADLSCAVRMTPERRRFLAFSDPYGTAIKHVVYTRRDSPLQVQRLADLKSLQLGVVAGYAFPKALTEALPSQPVVANDMPSLLRLVVAGRLQAALLNLLPAHWLKRTMGLEALLKLQPFEFDSGDRTQMAFSLRAKGQVEALAAMNRGLGLLGQAGPWSRFETRYVRLPGPAAPPPSGGGG